MPSSHARSSMIGEGPRVRSRASRCWRPGGVAIRIPSQPVVKGRTMSMSHVSRYVLAGSILLLLLGCATTGHDDRSACAEVVAGGLRAIATDPAARFLGKVHEATARCR